MEEICKMTQIKIDKLLEDDVWKLQKQRIHYLMDKNSKMQQHVESSLANFKEENDKKFNKISTKIEDNYRKQKSERPPPSVIQ